MPVFAVHYRYADDSADGRDVHRPAHRAFLDTLAGGAVEMLASGPYADEPAGALLIFRAESAAEVEKALDADPFALQGFVSARQVRPWSQSRGPWTGAG
jgi:uncharacterized protein YciI